MAKWIRPIKKERRWHVDYFQALQHGVVKVAYARVMLIGPGGVGKSSLLSGLMKKKFSKLTESTQGADIFNLRPTESYWARSTGGHWEIISDEDEIKELAQLLQRVQQNEQLVKGSPSKSSLDQTKPSFIVKENEKFDHPSVMGIVDEINAASSVPNTQNSSQPDTEVYLRVWDCGGQPVFLNLLSAFLTARTLFLLMFDASLDLHGPCLHLTHHEGRATEQLDDMSTLQLMVQWMANIHATLLEKGSVGSSFDDGKVFPRILPVGTHGDKAYAKDNKDAILRTLAEASRNRAFASHLLDGVIVDNTTAGAGESEDPAFQVIHEIADKFAEKDLAIDTPITWVLFRKVFERYSRGKPVVAVDEVKELAKACLIPEDTTTSVLAFYHDLSVFFHYSSVPSLKYKVISDPRWLIKQMAKILALKGFEEVRNDALWSLLREDGILVEQLYSQVFSNQEDCLKPQEIIDLMEHFLIIARVLTSNKHKYPGREYFVPSMLRRVSNQNFQATSNVVQSAAPIHLIFSTNYLPPGFFPRLVNVLSKHPNFTIAFEAVYRNEIKFRYGHRRQQVDEVIVTEQKSSVLLRVHRIHPRPRKYTLFPGICQEMLQILQKAFEAIKVEWFTGIDIGFAFQCKVCHEKDHFIPLQFPASSSLDFNSSLYCQNNVASILTPEQRFWFGVDDHEDTQSEHDIPTHEILEVANEIEQCGKVYELRKALERSDDPESTSAQVLLDRWQKEMKSMGNPPRPHLMYHLARMGLKELHTKLLYEEVKSEQYELVAKQEIEKLKKEIEDSRVANDRDIELKTLEIEGLKDTHKRLRSSEEIAGQKYLGMMKLNEKLEERNSSNEALISQKDQEIEEMRKELEQLRSISRKQPSKFSKLKKHVKKQFVESRNQRSQSVYKQLDGSPESASDVHNTLTSSTKARISREEFDQASNLLQQYSHIWKRIGQHLGFTANELSLIEAAPTHLANAPSSWLTAMLSSWQQWAPGDHRGSTSYATLDSLRTAVDKAGLGLTAQEL